MFYYPDVRIFRDCKKQSLTQGEYILADSGWTDDRCIGPGDPSADARAHELLRARHETVNQKLKNFDILATPLPWQNFEPVTSRQLEEAPMAAKVPK